MTGSASGLVSPPGWRNGMPRAAEALRQLLEPGTFTHPSASATEDEQQCVVLKK